jgi:hypothetical protein
MRKLATKLILIAVLTLIAVACTYWLFAGRGGGDPPIVDSRLIGTWLSSDVPGYRLVFMRSGDFVVTYYGLPRYGAETWSAQNGHMRLNVMGEHGEALEFDLTYTLSQDGQRMSLSKAEFGVSSKEYVRAMTKP